jgi:XTP/dITP diphosphohydrolase
VNTPVLVLASQNSGKVREIGALLSPFGFTVKSAKELGLPEPEETGRTFAENAAIKSEAAARETGLPALADDSGLVVRALNGAPGAHSARWAGPERNFGRAMERVEKELNAAEAADFSAKFVCALAFTRPRRATEIFEGEVQGTLTFPPRGTNGFGYDPIFVVNGMTQTFGEMEPSRKDTISHRAHAFAKLSVFLERDESAA